MNHALRVRLYLMVRTPFSGTVQMGVLISFPGIATSSELRGTGPKDAQVDPAPQRRLSNTRIVELPL